MKPAPNPNPGSAPGTATMDDLRKVLEGILETLERGRSQRGRDPDEQQVKATGYGAFGRQAPEFWRGAKTSLRTLGISGNQAADAISKVQNFVGGIQEMVAALRGTREAQRPSWSRKMSDDLGMPPPRRQNVRVSPAPPVASTPRIPPALPQQRPPLSGPVSWPTPSPGPLPPLSGAGQSWLNPPILPPSGGNAMPPALGWTPPAAGTVLPTGAGGGGLAGGGGPSDDVSRQMLNVLQQILAALGKLDQDEDANSIGGTSGEHENDRDEFSASSGSGGNGGRALLELNRASGSGERTAPPTTPAKDEQVKKSIFDKAQEWIVQGFLGSL